MYSQAVHLYQDKNIKLFFPSEWIWRLLNAGNRSPYLMQKSAWEQLFLELLSSIFMATPGHPHSLLTACLSWECPHPLPCVWSMDIWAFKSGGGLVFPRGENSLRPSWAVRESILQWQRVLRTSRFKFKSKALLRAVRKREGTGMQCTARSCLWNRSYFQGHLRGFP